MNYLDEINHFFRTYKRNFEVYCDWNDRIYQTAPPDTWLLTLKQRAKELSRIYQENQSLIQQLLVPMEQDPDQITSEEYEAVFHWTRDMYLESYDDPFILKRLVLILLPHYEALQNYDRLAFLYLALGYSYIEISRTGDTAAGQKSVLYYQKLTALRSLFAEFQEDSSRTFIFTAYCNLILVERSIGNISWQYSYQLYLEFQQLRQQEEFCRYDECTPRLKDLATITLSNFKGISLHHVYLYVNETQEELDADPLFQELKAIFHDFYGNFLNEAPDYPDYTTEQVFYGLQNLVELGTLSYDKAWKMADNIYHTKIDSELMQDIDPIGVHINPLDGVFELLVHTSFSQEQKLALAAGYRHDLLTFLSSYPTGIHSYTLNNALRDVCKNANIISLIPDAQELEKFVSELMVARHLTTHIHSIIVGELSVLLTNHLIQYAPEQFAGLSVPGLFTIPSIEAVTQYSDQLSDYIRRAALLHDVGKNGIVDIINTEYRGITDEEFALIKQHPQIGAAFLERSPWLSCYRDIALGHHKSYDGTFGYPASFDNTASPLRILIDIVTISDTLDAATDRLGRNYHTAKTLDQVLAEIQSQAGTRYHPGLIAMILDQPELYASIEQILTVERRHVYYNIYCKYFEKPE